MGTFSIIPLSGVAYYVITKSPAGSEVRSNIPECFPSGVVINISKNQTKEVGVTIRTNPKTLARKHSANHGFTGIWCGVI